MLSSSAFKSDAIRDRGSRIVFFHKMFLKVMFCKECVKAK
ncbi:hypothetical protein Hac_1488 [Helicobacter acinonychis str. Sheeba]|uniref:Uncharacterized protein n=1 Tax=Helicobacter acinonychis (strain Sheeba) TaxID=382638 RepID=Q17VW5_HELAH|nr:hypothetical protein Hac_1488 [Helicobacter acinonychis str. Sheeba]